MFYFQGFGFLRKLSNHKNYQIYVIMYNIQIQQLTLLIHTHVHCNLQNQKAVDNAKTITNITNRKRQL